MSASPPDDPPEQPEGTFDGPPKRPRAVALWLGIVAGVAALLGVWTLVGAGVCAAMLAGLRG